MSGMDFYHVLLDYPAVSAPDPAAFRKTLEVCGIRPVAPFVVDDIHRRLVALKFVHVSELFPMLQYADGPAWDRQTGPYEPDPAALASAERCFEEAKGYPAFESDELDVVSSDLWEELYKAGKPGLFQYCRNHPQAVQILTPEEKGDIIRMFFRRMFPRCLEVAAGGEYARLLRGLRIPEADWPPRGEVPFGLLKRFTQEVGRLGRGFLAADPVAWWYANEASLPDLT